ncbi:MAG: AAA family ATPase [Intrasporangiaceae bacterium]|nr:AAA family ATPase [Intrasporangiaceae bacterium]
MAAQAPGVGEPVFVGRVGELDEIRSTLERARAGSMQALLVSGDAGIGKTRLVQQACVRTSADDPGVVVLSGACLPLGTMTVPLVPIRGALRGAPADLRAPPLRATDGVEPAGWGASPPEDVVVAVDEWLERVCRERPVVLVVDDLQWADESTLDVLMYVVAGSLERRLAVVCTVRRGEVGTGDALQRWLADVRRMPCYGELRLGPLDRAETREQVGSLLRASPHESLVEEVHARTGGNAYLNQLLVEDLPPDARHLGAHLPPDLGAAVLRPWHRLSEQARELVRIIAVGGEVAGGPSLARAARLAGVPAEQAGRLLREAVEAGVLDVDPGGGYWFHHPLQAEALEASLAPEELRELHAAFAAQGEKDLAAVESAPHENAGNRGDGVGDESVHLAQVIAVADHHYRAGHPREAHHWALRAVDAGERAGTGGERLRLLRRAVTLREQLGEAEESTLDLLLRLRTTAATLGAHEDELAAVEAVLDLVDEGEQPLLVAELLIRLEHLRFATGRGFRRVDPARRAVALSEPDPGSWQHAYALAELAHASLWREAPDAHDVAAAALESAVAVGEPAVLAYAYATSAMSTVFRGEPRAPELAARGIAAAIEARDWHGFIQGAVWEANATASDADPSYARVLQGRRESLEELGAPHSYIAWLSAVEAGSWLNTGRWQECTDRLRVALGSDPGVTGDVLSRLVSTRLAVLQGRQSEAQAHLARAEELSADSTAFIHFEFDAVRAMVRLAAGDASGAVQAALTAATSAGAPPPMCEWLMPLAARGLADLAEGARARGEPLEEPLARLDALVARFPHVIRDNDESPFYLRQVGGLDALYAAEVARARRSADEPERWSAAAALLDGILPWEEAYAAFRAAESRLVRGQGNRDEAASMLRRAHALACRLRAEPIVREVEDLARAARIPLDEITPSPAAPDGPSSRRPWGITPRQQEILDHIVAGRTYGEIARALFLSEKTVSSHVSSLLRKTGAANRVELARLAQHHHPREP